jgi:hypothetical protein
MLALYVVAGCNSSPFVFVTSPPLAESTIDAESADVRGTATPGAYVVIQLSGTRRYGTPATEGGTWAIDVPLVRGTNDLTITATDPATQMTSASLLITINRP